jgi:hypothetical protein
LTLREIKVAPHGYQQERFSAHLTNRLPFRDAGHVSYCVIYSRYSRVLKRTQKVAFSYIFFAEGSSEWLAER